MKDLYKAIGLAGPTGDAGAIERAIATSKSRPAAARAARQILLNPTRKGVYDRTHAVVSRIGQLRANLGLSRAPHWAASDCSDFDTSPSAVRSQLEALRARARAARQRTTTERSQGRSGLVGLGVLGVLVVLGIIVANSDKGTSSSSDRPYPQPSRSWERYAPPQPSVPTREERIRSLARKRTERAGSVIDSSAVEALVQKLMGNQAEALPRTGVLSRGFYGAGVAPLAIKTRLGSNYYVKVLDWTSKREMLTAFICGGEPFETVVPVGSYEIKYAAGHSWYGPTLDFGEDASYSRCDERFDFTMTSEGYTGYTIELILQQHGNLETDPISADDF